MISIAKSKYSARWLAPALALLAFGMPAVTAEPVRIAATADDTGTTTGSTQVVVGNSSLPASPNDYNLTFDDIYEVGLSLARIRQQAINIYVEANRKPANLRSGVDIVDPDTIPVRDSSSSTCLPARREWLVYYMASMEPIIKLLQKDVDDTKSGAVNVKIETEDLERLESLWGRWQVGVEDMNKQLEKLLELFEDAPNQNAAIAERAVAINEAVNNLEKVRREVYTILVSSEKTKKKKANTPVGKQPLH